MVSVQTSRSVIVLAPEGAGRQPGDQGDPGHHQQPRAAPRAHHIVAEMHDPRNADVARMVGKSEVELVLLGDLISRITVQTCRQSGLSIVITELLDFGGDEIYFSSEAALTGKTFGESLFAYDDCCVMGVRWAAGGIKLNPPMETVLADGDQLIVIAEDDSAIRLRSAAACRPSTRAPSAPPRCRRPSPSAP
jgi:Trk K+ transport system NAD-binding subunit